MAYYPGADVGGRRQAVRLAVVIPCHNQGKTLKRAVKSALPFADKIYLYDDASSDNVWQAMADCAHINSKVEYILSQSRVPLGPVAARNLLITRAADDDMDLIIPLDADDWFLEGGGEALRDAYQPGTFVYGGFEQGGRHFPPAPIGAIKYKNVAWVTFLFAVADWQRVGGYSADFGLGCEHWALMAALLEAGFSACKIDQSVFSYSMNNDGRAVRVRKHLATIRTLLKERYPRTMG